jgi:hypothetical protein
MMRIPRRLKFKTGSILRRTPAVASVLLLASCGLDQRAALNIERQRQQQVEDYHLHIGEDPQQKPQVPLHWKQAHQRMMSDNLSLKQSALQRDESAKMAARQWKSLIPKMAAFLNLGESLSELTKLDGDSLNGSVVANLNIPNPFAFYASLYAAALQKKGAEWQHEINQRRAYIDLLGAYSNQRFIDEYAASIARREKLGATTASADPASTVKSVVNERRILERMRSSHRLRLNRLFNTPGANWRLAGNSPNIDYSRRIHQVRIGGDFGKMALNMQAIQIELAHLRTRSVRLRQLPNINFGLGLPPLYNTNQGTTDFGADNILFFSSIGKSIDLTDPLGLEEIQNADIRLAFTRQTLRQRMEEESVRIRQTAADYSRQHRELRNREQRLTKIETTPTSDSVVLLAALSERETLLREIADMQRQLELIEHQLLLWDERHWK